MRAGADCDELRGGHDSGKTLDVTPIAGCDRLDSRHHVEHRTFRRRSAQVVPLHLRPRSGSRISSGRLHRRTSTRSPSCASTGATPSRHRSRLATKSRSSLNPSGSSPAESRRRSATVALLARRRGCVRWSCRWSRRVPSNRRCRTRWWPQQPRWQHPGRSTPSTRRRSMPPRLQRRTGELPEDPRVAAAEIPPPLLLPRSTARPADADATNATRSVWLAVFFAAACAAVMFVEGPAPTHSDAVEAPPTPPDITVAVTPAPARPRPSPPPSGRVPRPAPPWSLKPNRFCLNGRQSRPPLPPQGPSRRPVLRSPRRGATSSRRRPSHRA